MKYTNILKYSLVAVFMLGCMHNLGAVLVKFNYVNPLNIMKPNYSEERDENLEMDLDSSIIININNGETINSVKQRVKNALEAMYGIKIPHLLIHNYRLGVLISHKDPVDWNVQGAFDILLKRNVLINANPERPAQRRRTE